MLSLLIAVAGLSACVYSSPISAFKTCKDYTIPLNVTSLNVNWALEPFQSNYDVADFLTAVGRHYSDIAIQPVTAANDLETALYTISGTLCEPKTGGNGNLMIATHGGGYDKLYWDPTIQPEKYSFVDHAVRKGYSIFYYDRLGIGQSTRVSGYVAQNSNQAAILEALIKGFRSGKTTGSKPSKIILVGHSFGSGVSNTVLSSYPESVDAAILTGFSYYGGDPRVAIVAKQLRIASTLKPSWAAFDNGYITSVDKYADSEGHFKDPYYDRAVTDWAYEDKTPGSILELFGAIGTNFTSPDFKGPVLLMDGEYDFEACEGYCPGHIEKGVSAVFPASSKLVTYSQPGSGHAINLSLNATGSYEVITNFLRDSGF